MKDIEMVKNYPVYKGVALEKAELQELNYIFKDVVKGMIKSVKPFMEAIQELTKSLSDWGNTIFGTKYQTEKYIQQNSPEHWLKWKYGS